MAPPGKSNGHDEPLALDLDADDANHVPLSEDELLLDLKDDHHEHHA
jgi:hypothetical protein